MATAINEDRPIALTHESIEFGIGTLTGPGEEVCHLTVDFRHDQILVVYSPCAADSPGKLIQRAAREYNLMPAKNVPIKMIIVELMK